MDPRILIVLGIIIFSISMWQLGHLTNLSGEDDTRVALLIRGFGLGFLFAPINQVAYASINPREAQQASGLINLARQLGGSFGIAILGTYLTHRTDIRRAELVTYLYPGNPQLAARLNPLIGLFHSHGYGPEAAKQAAYGVLNQQVMVHARTSSYNDCYIMILIAFICTAPAIFLLNKPKGKPAAAVDAH